MSTTTKKTFEDFFTELKKADAVQIGEDIVFPIFEKKEDKKGGFMIHICGYRDESIAIAIPSNLNKEIEFDTASRMFRVKGFRAHSIHKESSHTNIRFLKIA